MRESVKTKIVRRKTGSGSVDAAGRPGQPVEQPVWEGQADPQWRASSGVWSSGGISDKVDVLLAMPDYMIGSRMAEFKVGDLARFDGYEGRVERVERMDALLHLTDVDT